MKLSEVAEKLNKHGLNAHSISISQCPSWYGLKDIEDCCEKRIFDCKATRINDSDICRACWGREV